MSSGKRKKRIRKDWLLMSWLAAAAVALGLISGSWDERPASHL